MKKRRRYICTVHAEIVELADEILELELPMGFRSRVRSAAKKIRVLAEEAADSGQVIEGRLQEYRAAVENLGFVRSKKRA